MSWNASLRIASGTDKSQAAEMIQEWIIPPQSGDCDVNVHAKQVDTAKAAAIACLKVLPERVGMDYNINLFGHTCVCGINYDYIGVHVGHIHTEIAQSCRSRKASFRGTVKRRV